MPVSLFPNWIVKLVRQPNLQTKFWLNRPVEVFHVSPRMTKFEIKEYLVKLYNLPVSHVHTAIYEGKRRQDPMSGRRTKDPDYKKAYVYLHDAHGEQKPPAKTMRVAAAAPTMYCRGWESRVALHRPVAASQMSTSSRYPRDGVSFSPLV